jgi:hypothetical protein
MPAAGEEKNRVFLARFCHIQILRLALTGRGYALAQTQRLGLRPRRQNQRLGPAAAGTVIRQVFLPGTLLWKMQQPQEIGMCVLRGHAKVIIERAYDWSVSAMRALRTIVRTPRARTTQRFRRRMS